MDIVGNLYSPEYAKPAGLLFLHGGGVGKKERYRELQSYLFEKGYPSFAFDSRGVGESDGVFEKSTLKLRLEDAVVAFDYFKKTVEHIIVVGTSMGAHVAIRLTQMRSIAGLILLYGAAYSKESENKPFNKSFTRELRKEYSWKNSPAFSILKNYKKPVLIMYSKKDTVIPKGVQEEYRNCLKTNDTFVELSHAGHIMLKPENENEEKDKQRVFDEIERFLSNVTG